MQSRTDRFSFIVGEPKEGEGILNPNTGPGMSNLQKYNPFGDFNYPGDQDYPGIGPCAKISDQPRWGRSYEERRLEKEREIQATRPFSQATEIGDKAAWEKDGAHRMRDTYPAPQQQPGTFKQGSRFTPRNKRTPAVVPSDFRHFKRGMSWEARKKGYRPACPVYRKPPSLRATGSEPFYTGKRRDEILVEKVKQYQRSEIPRLPAKCRHGGRPILKRDESEETEEVKFSESAKGMSIGFRTTQGPNIHKGGIMSEVERTPESCYWIGKSVTVDMEIANLGGGLVDFVETKRTWGLATAKEKFRMEAEITGISLEKALEKDRNKKRKKKVNSWRPSDEKPPAKLVLGARLGAGGMARQAEVAVLKQVDRHLGHVGKNPNQLQIHSDNGPSFSCTIVKD